MRGIPRGARRCAPYPALPALALVAVLASPAAATRATSCSRARSRRRTRRSPRNAIRCKAERSPRGHSLSPRCTARATTSWSSTAAARDVPSCLRELRRAHGRPPPRRGLRPVADAGAADARRLRRALPASGTPTAAPRSNAATACVAWSRGWRAARCKRRARAAPAGTGGGRRAVASTSGRGPRRHGRAAVRRRPTCRSTRRPTRCVHDRGRRASVALGVVSMGNPHAVLAVDDVRRRAGRALGRGARIAPRFPDRCNVGFAQRRGCRPIRLRVYERGVGETLACGTGACAAVAVLRRRGVVGDARRG